MGPGGVAMKQVAVYSSERRSNALRKDCLVYASIDQALDAMPDVAWHRGSMAEVSRADPGLREIRPHDPVVALGRAAHNVLADYRKRTLLMGRAEDEACEEDIARLVWSCVNTSKAIALGRGAWRWMQILPIADRRFYAVPPLRIAPASDIVPVGASGSSILVIDHEADGSRAATIGETLESAGFLVQHTGRARDGEGQSDEGGWSSRAAIHVHVGFHDGGAEEMRLLDTWHSRRFAILVTPRRVARHAPENSLMVEADVNGFLCDTPGKVLAAIADLGQDPVLRKKMLEAGLASVAPLAREWLTIASDLVA